MYPTRRQPNRVIMTSSSELSQESWRACPPLQAQHGTIPLAGHPASPANGKSDEELPHIDGYVVRQKLGAGGMGSVYRAFDEQLRVEVALKVPQSLTLSAQERFLEEAQRLAAVQHRNVVSVRNFGRNTDRVYFSMQLIDGPNGLDLIRTFQRQAAHRRPGAAVLEMAGLETSSMLPELSDAARGGQAYYRLVAHWVAGAADGLDAAHRRGLLHRDVKPANFLMASDGRLLVADFGLAVTNDDLVGRGRGLAGTFPYVAPERLTGDQATIDQRADVWALGATLYEFLTYRRAYERDGLPVLQDIATRDPLRPRRLAPHVPRGLDAICRRAMRRDPAARYPSAAALAADLRRWAGPTRRSLRRALGLLGSVLLAILLSALVNAGPHVSTLPSSPVGPFGVEPAAPEFPPQAPSTAMAAASTAPAPQPLEAHVVLLCFREDLNAADELPPRMGGRAGQRVGDHLAAHAFTQALPLDMPPLPTLDQALAVAEAHQARFLVWGEVQAEPERVAILAPDGRTEEQVITAAGPGWFWRAVETVSPAEQVICHWTVRVRLRVVDVASRAVLWEREEQVAEPRRLESAYGGDAHAKLAGTLGQETLKALTSALD